MRRKQADVARSKMVGIRMDPAFHEVLRKVAYVEQRGVAGLVESVMFRYVLKNYPQAFDPKSKLVVDLTSTPDA